MFFHLVSVQYGPTNLKSMPKILLHWEIFPSRHLIFFFNSNATFLSQIAAFVTTTKD